MARKSDPGKKEHIIRAATHVFAQKGYAATRIIEVAEAAGIGKGTIYEYFRSKEDLFFAVFEQMILDTGSQMRATIATISGSAASRLKAVADTTIGVWLSKLDVYTLVMEFWSATTALPSRQRFKTAFQNSYQEFRQVLADLIKDGMRAGEFNTDSDPQKTASALIGTWDALLLQAWLDSDFDPLGTSQSFIKVVLKGLGSKTSKEPS